MRRGCEEMHHRQLHQKERSLALSLRVRCVWIDKALRKNKREQKDLWRLAVVGNGRDSEILSKDSAPIFRIIPTACTAIQGCTVGIWVIQATVCISAS